MRNLKTALCSITANFKRLRMKRRCNGYERMVWKLQEMADVKK